MDWLGLRDFLIVFAIFVPLERLVALHRGQKIFRRHWHQDLIYYFVNGSLIKLAIIILLAGVIFAASWLVPEAIRGALAGQPYWLQVAQIMVLGDIGFYCVHRAFHAVPLLWRFHAIHHSIEELDWLAGARIHPIDQTLTKGASLLPSFALGYSDIAIGIYLMIFYWQAFLIHANVRIPFGPLRWVLASPEFHHWHHSNDAEARNRNFASQLPVLDLLFGTLHLPRGKMPARYGIDDPVPPGYLPQLLYPFQRRAEASGSGRDDLASTRSPAVPAIAPTSAWEADAGGSLTTGMRAHP
jgi:sterol desaturase/sphingolipid hydroxylase (fatty acid hydroxylase superfamily)